MTVLTVIQYAFLAYAGWSLLLPIKERRWKRYWSVFARRTPIEWVGVLAETLLVLALVGTVGTVLYIYGGAVAQFSWLQLISTPEERETPRSLISGGAAIPWIGIVFVLLLAFNIPRLARWEEYVFRDGTKSLGQGVGKSLKFGIAHAGVGVPIAFCLALAITGMWLTQAYLGGGIRHSTWKHATYNLVIAGVLLYVLLSG
ncbi:MAG: hypothetical protein HONBIEJF_01017 [Fimbriimonadaceae bacterium]|nr:hypothetical protein [Fimbriimonadaceae bacterium]